MKKHVWAYPIVGIFLVTVVAMFLQSCGVVRLDKIHDSPTAEELDKKIEAVSLMCGTTLITGFLFCLYIYWEVKKLDIKIIKLTSDRE